MATWALNRASRRGRSLQRQEHGFCARIEKGFLRAKNIKMKQNSPLLLTYPAIPEVYMSYPTAPDDSANHSFSCVGTKEIYFFAIPVTFPVFRSCRVISLNEGETRL